MSTGKKWLVRFFLLVFVALVTMGLWLPPIITHAVEKDYHFPEVDIDATVQPNGDLMLEETRTFDFQNGPFTYAYFNVDDPLDHVRDFTIAEKLDDGTEVPVTPDFASHSIVTEGFQSQWSYSAEDETRTWVFRYRVACAVDVYSDTAHLYWQFIGSGWDQPTQHAVITVHLPGHSASDARRPRACHPEGVVLDLGQTPLTRGEVRAFGHGPLNGEVTFVNPQTIRYDVHDVPPLSYVEGSILFPADAVPTAVATDQPGLERILDQERVWADEANALRERHQTERDWVLYLLIGVPVALALLVLLARYRDRVPGVPKILEQPPEEDPVQGSVLWSAWAGHLSPQNAYRAQLLKLARLGAIEMKADGRVSDPKDLTLIRKMDATDLQTELDQDFMWLLFGRGEDAVDEVSVNHPKPRKAASSGTYAAWWSGVKMKSGDITLRIRKGDARLESTLAAIIAIGAAGYGIWTAVWGLGGAIGWWLVPVAAISLVAALIKIHARLGLEDRARVKRLEAFRTYLKDFSDLPNAPALAVVIWEQYLEWAVALGVADEVEKQVKALVPVESLRSPIRGAPTGLAGLTAWQHFQSAAPALVLVSMASANSGSSSGGFGSSSSSGGFSGGGFSGGGGGGGGGTGGGAG
ncbi:MAG TPA: DUF2207 domain-containing protein [Actinomycetota bacterium]|nr:DUF2207 domain-containing protein [Actinomycetota bacterium]